MKKTDRQQENVQKQLLSYLRERENTRHPLQQEEVWQRIIRQHRLMKLKRIMVWSTAVAAVLGGILFTLPFLKETETDLMDYVTGLQRTEAELTEQIRLITSAGTSIPLQEKSKSVAYDREGLAYVGTERLEIPAEEDAERKEATETGKEKIKYNRLLVPSGKYIRLILSDGSELDINSGSEVVYPTVFTGDIREIFVDGEIFIDVKKSEQGTPFVVRTSRCDIRVLGTAFNVRAYESAASTEVVLQRGIVEVKDKAKKVVRMKPNERTTLVNGHYKGTDKVDVDKYTLWRKGILLFEGETVGQAVRKLTRFYGLSFSCTPEVRNIRLYGKLDINEPIENVLSAICSTAGLQYKMKNNGYEFMNSD